jgi:hypothetical protein
VLPKVSDYHHPVSGQGASATVSLFSIHLASGAIGYPPAC